MPRVIITADAGRGLERCRLFLAAKNPPAARRAGQAIEQKFALLATSPEIGRPWLDSPDLREILIAFGNSGYAALYRYDPASDMVYVLAFRHAFIRDALESEINRQQTREKEAQHAEGYLHRPI